MKRPSKINIKPKILIFILTLICIATLILSVTVKSFSTPFKTVAGVVIVPLQEGVNSIGGWFTDKSDLLKSVKSLKSENDKLKAQVDELTEENSLLAQNKYELTRLRDLYQLDKDYSSLKKSGQESLEKTPETFLIFLPLTKAPKTA